MKNNHSISIFLISSFHQRRKSEQQSRIMQPTILKLLRKKQKRDYHRRRISKIEITVNCIVLLKNNKRFDRKGGKFFKKWLGPYTVMNISDKGVATLKNASGVTFNKYNIVQLKNTTFKEQMANQNQHQMKICTFLESRTRRNC